MKFITFFVLFGMGYFAILSNAYAGGNAIIYTNDNSAAINQSDSGTALAIATSQHHYKATKSLQWSAGTGYVENTSAVSFGLGKQVGKVFVSGNFSSNGSSSAIGFGASGTF